MQTGPLIVGLDPMQEVKDCLVNEGLGLHECTAKFASDNPSSGADGLKVNFERRATISRGEQRRSGIKHAFYESRKAPQPDFEYISLHVC